MVMQHAASILTFKLFVVGYILYAFEMKPRKHYPYFLTMDAAKINKWFALPHKWYNVNR